MNSSTLFFEFAKYLKWVNIPFCAKIKKLEFRNTGGCKNGTYHIIFHPICRRIGISQLQMEKAAASTD
ncbi:hypothetical protein DXC69_09945 [Paenibacillus polymyxa]|nr:hypothetical protein C1T20_00160 [Paenibacillus polymyxa]RFT95964.1 hypothetical protein DX902_16230 [Paenibacillus jamilae]UOD88622.1 hypothetical protein CUU60_01640 [Paenibacillus polymyxa ATCC 842]PTU44838.1 hypothetical protein DBL67_21460 [Paenibacillus polymyxa]QDA30168.1 hypothetical protein FGY93_21520 [Paenibacillus polymyxa]